MVWPFVKAGRRSDPKITIMREVVLLELSVAAPRPVVHAVGMAMIHVADRRPGKYRPITPIDRGRLIEQSQRIVDSLSSVDRGSRAPA